MLSSGMYGRLCVQPDCYAHQVAQYDRLFQAFPRAATFAGPMMGYRRGEIVILRVRQ